MHDMNNNWRETAMLTTVNRVDVICDAFEQSLRSGERPDIAEFLHRCNTAERPALFCELLLVEREYLRRCGEQFSLSDYLRRFPEFAEHVQAVEFKYGSTGRGVDTVTHTDTGQRILIAGMRIAQFELLEKLGTGSAGEVWKARDARLQRSVALKIPRSHQLSEAELHRFLREGRAAAQLRHPNIVAVHEVDRCGETMFIVSEWIEGEDLRSRLTRHRFAYRDASSFCAKLAEALHYAHLNRIVHRDLKPANVIVDKNEQPHIADFGLAKWMDDACEVTLNGELLGTPAYMSPEQARGSIDHVDSRSDVYALGVLLYEILAGRCPFQGDRSSVVQAILYQEPPPPRTLDRRIPLDLETICLKAIHKNSNHRYQTAKDMADDLWRYLNGEPIAASRPSHLQRTWLWARRRPAVVAAATMALVRAVFSRRCCEAFRRNSRTNGSPRRDAGN